MKTKFTLILLVILLSFAVSAHAELVDRGGGLIYDTDLDLTWMQDANYLATAGYDDDGLIDLSGDFEWPTINYQGYSDWGMTFDSFGVGEYPCLFIDSDCLNTRIGHLFWYEDVSIFNNLQDDWYWASYYTDEEIVGDLEIVIVALKPNYEYSLWERFSQLEHYNEHYVLLSRPGDSTPLVPEPISSILFIVGGGILGFRRLRKRVS